jgi:cytochrome c
MAMRSTRGKGLKAPLLLAAAASAMLMGWAAARWPGGTRTHGAVAENGPPDGQASTGEGTSTPAAAKMLPHLLAWGTGPIAITAALWITSGIWMVEREADAVARALTGGDPANAATLATRYGCAGCHTIPGLPGAEGRVGPPLKGLRQRVFVAGVLPNTADNLINWIVAPHRYAPRSAMPETGIGSDGARDIAAYLYAH